MRVLHAFAGSRLVNGVNQTVWQLSAAQAAMSPDDRITVLTFDSRATAPPGVQVVAVSPLNIPAALARLRPDVLHLHSVLRPELVIATLAARRLGVPVVAQPHGGYAPRAIARRNMLKQWYTRSVELLRMRHTRLFLALTDREAANIRTLYPGATVRTVGNGVTPLAASSVQQYPPNHRPTLVYLGRSDIEHKGLDRLMRLVSELPEAQLLMYGNGLEKLGRAGMAPRNVRFMGVAAGPTKAAALAGASCYVQLSRFEAYGRSIVEAMGLGVSVAISADCDLADEVRRLGLGLVLDDADDPVGSARALRRYLDSPLAEQCARRAREWALSEATPAAAAHRTAQAYASVAPAEVDRSGVVASPLRLDERPRFGDRQPNNACQSNGQS